MPHFEKGCEKKSDGQAFPAISIALSLSGFALLFLVVAVLLIIVIVHFTALFNFGDFSATGSRCFALFRANSRRIPARSA
jgi:hypothetical protein